MVLALSQYLVTKSSWFLLFFFNADNAVVAADLTAWLNSLPKLLNQQVGSATYPLSELINQPLAMEERPL